METLSDCVQAPWIIYRNRLLGKIISVNEVQARFFFLYHKTIETNSEMLRAAMARGIRLF